MKWVWEPLANVEGCGSRIHQGAKDQVSVLERVRALDEKYHFINTFADDLEY